MKMIPATCQCGVEFLREPHDDYPRCSECFFEHDAPALKILTDQVSTEEQRGPIRQEENRAAQESAQQEGAETMSNATTTSISAGITAIIWDFLPSVHGIEERGLDAQLTMLVGELCHHGLYPPSRVRSLLLGEAHGPTGEMAWREDDLTELSDVLKVWPDNLISAATHVAHHPGDAGALRDALRVLLEDTEEVAR